MTGKNCLQEVFFLLNLDLKIIGTDKLNLEHHLSFRYSESNF